VKSLWCRVTSCRGIDTAFDSETETERERGREGGYLFPLPLGPTMHTLEAMSRPKFTPLNSQGRAGPYRKLTSLTSMMGGLMMLTWDGMGWEECAVQYCTVRSRMKYHMMKYSALWGGERVTNKIEVYTDSETELQRGAEHYSAVRYRPQQ
jgi:hypothetical protein